jgi:hypothetical protein
MKQKQLQCTVYYYRASPISLSKYNTSLIDRKKVRSSDILEHTLRVKRLLENWLNDSLKGAHLASRGS